MSPCTAFGIALGLGVAVVSGQDPQIYPSSSQPTAKGCECTSACSTRTLAYCNSAEICSVASKDCANGTAEWNLALGYYDYCTYPAYTPYESLSAKEKQQLLLDRVHKDATADQYPGALSLLTGILGESVRISFDVVSDIFPEKRTKEIHSVGVVAPIRWEALPGHSFGGLFQEGAEFGLIRFSSAIAPGKAGFTPGAGIKLLRDGRPSANFVAMPSLNGQTCDQRNFFAHTFTNHVPLPTGIALDIVSRKFWQASFCPLTVGISHMADGGEFPFQLQLQPAAGLNVDCDCLDYTQCMANLGKLQAGQALFDVYALAAPGATGSLVGKVTLTGSPATSKFGDEQLFFKHQYMEEDFALHPEWLQQIDPKSACGMKGVSTAPPKPDAGCSSPFGMGLNSDMVV